MRQLMRQSMSRASRAATWVERYYVFPAGLEQGQRVRLTPAQRELVVRLYDHPGIEALPVTGFLRRGMPVAPTTELSWKRTRNLSILLPQRRQMSRDRMRP
jgi:hypothetical protein